MAPATAQLEASFSRMLRLAAKLGRVEALAALVAGLQAGGDPVELIEGMLAYERMMLDARADRQNRRQ